MPYCPNCGASVTDKDKFCSNCKAKLKEEVVTERITIVRKRSWFSILLNIIIALLAIAMLLIIWYFAVPILNEAF